MAQAIVILSFVLFSSPAFADFFFKLETGVAYYTPAADGVWRQEEHPTHADWTSYYAGLGVGYDSPPWSYDITLQYFDGGRIYGEWEWDHTYKVSGADHTVQAYGVSNWDYQGFSLGANREFGRFYARGTITFLNYKWFFDGGRLNQPDHHDHYYFREKISTVGIGGGYRLTDGFRLEFVHYLNTSMSNGGVDAVTTFGLSLRL